MPALWASIHVKKCHPKLPCQNTVSSVCRDQVFIWTWRTNFCNVLKQPSLCCHLPALITCFSAGCVAQDSVSDAQRSSSPLSPKASSPGCGTADVTPCSHVQVLLTPALLEEFSLFTILAVAAAAPQWAGLATHSLQGYRKQRIVNLFPELQRNLIGWLEVEIR